VGNRSRIRKKEAVKALCILLVVIAALVAVYPVQAEECDPESIWLRDIIPVPFGVEQRGAIVDVVYDPAYYSLMLQGEWINWPWPIEITKRDNAGFTARIMRPVEYKNTQTIYLEYFAWGYVIPDGCFEPGYNYQVRLPLVMQ